MAKQNKNTKKLFVAFNFVKPAFIATSTTFNLPKMVMDWADNVYKETGNYDHDTFVVINMEEPNNANLQQFLDIFKQFTNDESLLTFYWNVINDINDRTSGILEDIFQGKLFNAFNTNDLVYFEGLLK